MIQQATRDLLWSQIVAQAWCDEGLMKRLRSGPQDVLAEYGLEVPEGSEVEVVEGTETQVLVHTDTLLRLTLPPCPPEELTEEDLVGSPVAQCFSGVCGACGACGRCGCRCHCRCSCRCF